MRERESLSVCNDSRYQYPVWIQYLGVITLSLEPAPLGAKHVRCSAPSRVRVPRVGALESPQPGLPSDVGRGTRTRDGAELATSKAPTAAAPSPLHGGDIEDGFLPLNFQACSCLHQLDFKAEFERSGNSRVAASDTELARCAKCRVSRTNRCIGKVRTPSHKARDRRLGGGIVAPAHGNGTSSRVRTR